MPGPVVGDLTVVRGLLDEARAAGRSVGYVPTMGALHDGHRSLIRRSVSSCDVSAVSIFVNPLQFGAGEDLQAYPRSLDADAAMATAEGVDLVFAPSDAAMFAVPALTVVRVDELSDELEGRARPTHFEGVATVVAKLFNLVGPCHAFFGEKDYQQLLLVGRMVGDLSYPVTVVGCPIVREPDGLALSSRNGLLSPAERAAAPVLARALSAAAAAIDGGESAPTSVEAQMAEVVAGEPLAELDYAVVRDPDTLGVVDVIDQPVRLLIAARLGATRLIDNRAAVPRAAGGASGTSGAAQGHDAPGGGG